jgi:replicative DNA helicase
MTERLGLIVIDYLTYIAPPRAESVAEGIQHITRALKGLAKELQVPVMLLSQLNREGDDEPGLKHLRSSGAIEQDADVIIFLHRPNKENRELVKAVVAKQRNGPCGDFHLAAKMDKMRFYPCEFTPPPKQERPTFGKRRSHE